MKSIFITGTDTDVGKTVISAGLSRAISNQGINIGVMKPFAAAELQSSSDFQSEDTEILAKAARVSDPEELLNPQFFPIPASPYTASQTLDMKVNLELVLEKFEELKKSHDMMLVEGMGGIMTPILENYFVADLIRDMKLQTIIVMRSKIGTVNHTLLTKKICSDYKIPVKGIIINNFDTEGYPVEELKRDIEKLTGNKVLGVIPKLESLDANDVADVLSKQVNISELLEN